MNVFTIKPEIKFPAFPIIYLWIEADYKKVQTQEDLVSFMHKCLNEAITTKNEVKKQAYSAVGNTMYSLLTSKSYETPIPLKL